MKIREIKKNDYDSFIKLYEEFDYPIGGTIFKIFLNYFKISKKDFENIMEDSYYKHYFLIGEDESIKGYSRIAIDKEKMFIDDFIIEREERRKGLGSKFYLILQEKAIKENVTEVEISIVTKEALLFWKKLGFKREVGKIFIKNI